MKFCYVITRKERHIEDRIWVCTDLDNAKRIADEVTEYWMQEYSREDDYEWDYNLHNYWLYAWSCDDGPSITIHKSCILENNEDVTDKIRLKLPHYQA